VYAYSNEGFDFLHPRLFRLLFSYSNGFFVYAPVMFIAALGALTLIGKNRFRFFALTGFLLVIDWALSSWWAWTYGGAFGMRPMIEYLPVFCILLVFLLEWLSRKKIVAIAIVFLFILPLCALTQVQTWQYNHAILAWDNMTKDMYWNVFLKTDKKYFFLYTDLPGAKIPPDANLVYRYFSDLEKQDTLIKNWETVTEEIAFSGKRSAHFENPSANPPFWSVRAGDILPDSSYRGKQLWLYAKMKFWLDKEEPKSQVLFDQQRNDSFPVFFNLRLNSLIYEAREWKDFEYTIQLQPLQPNDKLRVLPNKFDSTQVFFDDIEIRIYMR
jgi:hypothetical protein